MIPQLEAWADTWDKFKKFRQARWEVNQNSEKVKEIQKQIHETKELMHPKKKGIFGEYTDYIECYQLPFNMMLYCRSAAENYGIPPETMEGMFDWMKDGCPEK